MPRLGWIAVFGIVGIFGRYGLDTWLAPYTEAFPISTFGINLLGSFAAGLLFVFGFERGALPEDLRIGLMVGLLGGFTTFSAYSLQSARLFESGARPMATLYWLLSPLGGGLSAWAGLALGRYL